MSHLAASHRCQARCVPSGQWWACFIERPPPPRGGNAISYGKGRKASVRSRRQHAGRRLSGCRTRTAAGEWMECSCGCANSVISYPAPSCTSPSHPPPPPLRCKVPPTLLPHLLLAGAAASSLQSAIGGTTVRPNSSRNLVVLDIVGDAAAPPCSTVPASGLHPIRHYQLHIRHYQLPIRHHQLRMSCTCTERHVGTTLVQGSHVRASGSLPASDSITSDGKCTCTCHIQHARHR